MKNINFIPAYRRVARRDRRKLTRWITVGAAYLVLVAGGTAACYAVWSVGGATLAGELEKTKAQIQMTNGELRSMRTELEAKEKALRAEQAAIDQPDWSLLLAMLARSMGDGLVLTQCELRPVAAGHAPAAEPETTASFSLQVAGYGKTLPGVLRFAQELERSGVFDQIRLVKTDPEKFLAGTAVRFQMECTMGPKKRERAE